MARLFCTPLVVERRRQESLDENAQSQKENQNLNNSMEAWQADEIDQNCAVFVEYHTGGSRKTQVVQLIFLSSIQMTKHIASR